MHDGGARTAVRLVDNKGERPLLRRETAVGRRWRGAGHAGRKGGGAGRQAGRKKRGYHLVPRLCLPENRRLPVYLPEHSFVRSPGHAPIPRGPWAAFDTTAFGTMHATNTK